MHRDVASPEQRNELRAHILRDAVDDNVGVIEGRVSRTPSSTPAEPGGSASGRSSSRRSWPVPVAMLSIGVAVTIGLTGLPGSGPRASAPAARTGHPATAAPAMGRPEGTANGQPDPSLLARALDPGVLALSVRRVVVDAGHGGENRGTVSARGLAEKEVTLDIATQVRDILAARGFEVVMTRTEDRTLSLQERAETANTRRGDIFVSIHLNALRPATANGVETYYLGPSDGAEPDAVAAAENQHSGYSLSDMRALLERIYTDARRDESRRLATAVQRALVARMQQTERSIADRGVKRAPFVVLGATEMPAILAEVSCLSNDDEAQRLGTAAYRQTIAEAVVAGIEAFAHDSRTRGTERTGSSGS